MISIEWDAILVEDDELPVISALAEEPEAGSSS